MYLNKEIAKFFRVPRLEKRTEERNSLKHLIKRNMMKEVKP